jgi:hypothetical protein
VDRLPVGPLVDLRAGDEVVGVEALCRVLVGEIGVDGAAFPQDDVAVDQRRHLAVGVERLEFVRACPQVDLDDLERKAEFVGDGANADAIG